jgi:hypothetical protein
MKCNAAHTFHDPDFSSFHAFLDVYKNQLNRVTLSISTALCAVHSEVTALNAVSVILNGAFLAK